LPAHDGNASGAPGVLHRNENRPETVHISTIPKTRRRNRRNLTKKPFITSRCRH
jgi:hypothetical protein